MSTKIILPNGGVCILGQVKAEKFINGDYYDFSVHHHQVLNQVFEPLDWAIDNAKGLSTDDVMELREQAALLKDETEKREQADESFLMQRLRNIGRMAPEILEVAVAAVANPLLGLGAVATRVIQKIASTRE